MIYGYIYKITNLINNKIYIGQTVQTVEQRFRGHCNSAKRLKQHPERYKRPCEIHSAINKYGVENFIVEQIDTAESKYELNKKEIYWINYYDSTNVGYNMTIGGDVNPMFQEKTKNAHDEKMRSSEVRQRISESLSNYRKEFGFSDEHIKNIKTTREKRKAERAALGLNFYNHPENFATRSRAVYCILDSGERHDFKSILEAGKWWYETYKPFGETYSTATYQRKIEKSIAGEEISYGNKTHKKHVIITNIKWFYV